MAKRDTKFTEETVEKLKDIFTASGILEQLLINGEIDEEDFIAQSRELKFNIPDDRKKEYIENVWYRHEHKNETEEEFKERVIGKLTELGIYTISMRNEK